MRDPSPSSKRRGFEWLWNAIQDELKEHREDQKYDNLTKGLKEGPSPSVGLPAKQAKSDDAPASSSTSASQAKGGKSKLKGSQGQGGAESTKVETPALPAETKPPGRNLICALHAAGLCYYGDKCRHEHVGQPGSAQAKEAFVKSQQKGDGKGNEKAKGKGKSKGKSHPGGSSGDSNDCGIAACRRECKAYPTGRLK